MRIDYAIELPCEPRRRFGREGLLQRLRLRDQLRGGDHGEEADDDVREAGFQLRPMAFHCKGCPANHAGRTYGCFDRVETPISAEAETWLLDLLPVTLTPRRPSRAMELRLELVRTFLHRLETLEVDGTRFDEHFRRTAAQRSRRVVRKYGSLFRKQRVTSSQLLELFFLREHIEPTLAELTCRALGVWEDGGPGADGVPEVIFTEPVATSDHPSVGDLKQFLLALIVACSLNATVTTHAAAKKASALSVR